MVFTEEWAEAQIKRAREGFQPVTTAPVAGGPKSPPVPVSALKPKMNKWETAYAWNLELQKRAGLILDYQFETWKFRIAKRTWFTPDFPVIKTTGIEIHEVKGFMRDDANVKLKDCAERYPWFKWVLVTQEDGQWVYREVGK